MARKLNTRLLLNVLIFVVVPVCVGGLVLSMNWLSAGDPKELMDQAEKALKADPPEYTNAWTLIIRCMKAGGNKIPEAQYLLAKIALEQTPVQGQAALTAYNNALRLRPTYVEAQRDLTKLYMRMGYWEEVERQVQALLKLDPTSGEAYFWAALSQGRRADLEPLSANKKPFMDAAIAWCEKGVKAAPTYQDNYQLLAQLYARTEQTDKILPLLDQAIANNPTNAAVYTFKADYLVSLNKLDEAVAVLNQGLVKLKDDPKILAALGDAALHGGERLKAREYFVRAVTADPKSEVGYLRLSGLYRADGQPDEAVKVLAQGIEKIPDSIQLISEQADVYLDQRDFTKADVSLTQLEKVEPKGGRLLLLKGKRAFISRQIRQAITYLEQAQPLMQAAPPAWALSSRLLLGRAYLFADELGAADRTLTELTRDYPGIAPAWRALTEVQIRLGNAERAEKSAEQGVRLAPNDPDMHILHAQALDTLKRYNDALVESTRAELLAKDEPNPYLMSADLLVKLSRRADAEAKLRQALATGKDPANVYHTLAVFYRDGNQPAKVTEVLAEAKKALPPEQYAILEADVTGSTTNIEAEYEKRVKDGTATAGEILSLARLSQAANKPEKATELYEKVLTTAAPKSGEWNAAWGQLFVTELAAEAWPKAAALIDRMKKVNPEAPELLFADVLIDLGQNKVPEAEARLRAIIQTQGNSQAYFLLGQVLAREKKLDDAAAALNKSLDMKPPQPACWVMLARIYMMQMNYEQARSAADNALKYDPKMLAAMDIKAQALTALGRWALAVKAREEIAAVVPDEMSNQMAMAALYLQLHLKDKAEDVYVKAYKAKPDDPELVRLYAGFLVDTARPTKADQIVDAFLEKHKTEATAWVIRAELTSRTVSPAEAKKYYDKAAELKPDDPYPLLFLGDQFARVSDWKNAAEAYQRAIERMKDSTDATAQKRLADVYMLDGKLPEAQSVIDAVMKKHPDDTAAMVVAGRIAARQNESAKARQLYERALKTQPGYGEAQVRLAELDSGPDPARALEVLARVDPSDPSFEKAMLQRADINTRTGRIQDAILDYRRLLDFRPMSLAGRIGLASKYMAAGDFGRAATAYEELSRDRDDQDASLMAALGDALLRQSKVSEALVCYRKARSLAGKIPFPEALAGEARCLLSLKDTKGAFDLVYKVMNELPNDAWPRLALASLFELTKEPEKAVDAISTGILAHPDWEEGYIRKADILSRMPNKAKETREALEQGLAKVPGSVSLRTVLATAQSGAGETEAAMKTVKPLVDEFQKQYGTTPDRIEKIRPYMTGVRIYALGLYQQNKPKDALAIGLKLWDVDPMDLANANNMAWILATEEKQYQKAHDMVTRCLRLVPNNPQVLDTAGWISFLMGKTDDAVETLRSAIKYGPKMPDAYYHLGRVYESLEGRASDAIDQYNQALKLGLSGADKADAENRAKQLASSAK